jgi:hypothetical protein
MWALSLSLSFLISVSMSAKSFRFEIATIVFFHIVSWGGSLLLNLIPLFYLNDFILDQFQGICWFPPEKFTFYFSFYILIFFLNFFVLILYIVRILYKKAISGEFPAHSLAIGYVLIFVLFRVPATIVLLMRLITSTYFEKAFFEFVLLIWKSTGFVIAIFYTFEYFIPTCKVCLKKKREHDFIQEYSGLLERAGADSIHPNSGL